MWDQLFNQPYPQSSSGMPVEAVFGAEAYQDGSLKEELERVMLE